jgi:hypothetical protein
MGGHRGLVVPGAGSLLDFTGPEFHFAQSAGTSAQLLLSAESSVGDGKIRLETTAAVDACEKGDVGTYSWSLNSTGRILTISEDQDACSTRAGAIVGEWWLMDCPIADDYCLGTVDAGTYKSQFIAPLQNPGAEWNPVFGGVTYTVPDGWANSADWPERFELVPSTEVRPATDADRRRNIGLFQQPAALQQCSDASVPGVTRTVDALVSWLGTLPGLVTTAPTAITIDGHPGKALDVRMDPAWTKTCEGDPDTSPIVTHLRELAVRGGQVQRVILLDLGDSDVIGIAIWTRDQATFDAFIPQAMPVIESFKFG